MSDGVAIGKIVRSESHVRYTCQISGQGEVAQPPSPEDYAFGSFVRMPVRGAQPERIAASLTALPPPDTLRAPSADALATTAFGVSGGPITTYAVGLIYDTILLNPDFGALGPRLSNDTQVELFSPDYLSERAVIVSILLLGTMARGANGAVRVQHGVPPIAPELGTEVRPLEDRQVREFHSFADYAEPGGPRPYLHMGYLPHAIAQDHALLPLAMLRTIERLEGLFPENAALLSIVKRNFAWRLKVQSAG
ncbi:MAG: hypothetical protein ACRDHE_01760 [Ktedonobacterales bacterium]